MRSSLPRIHHSYTHRLKVVHVSGCNCHSMDKRTSCDESITIRTRIWNVKRSTTLSNGSINGQNSVHKRWYNVPIHPRAQNSALFLVTSFHETDSYLQFEY